jgi:predicted ABC-type transport system involved in lysophospholipase L1 biosynthesis ATPase subunit
MAEQLVVGRGVGRTFGSGESSVIAVRAASFEILAAERIAVIGPSGSGKSTLLHLLAGLDEPTEGEIEWPALGARAGLRPGPVAIAFQGPSLLPPLSVLENVALPVLLAGGDEGPATEAARGMVERFELSDVSAKLPEELSGGQSQRTGIARALAGRPRLLLADEPTGQQDGATGRRLMDALFEEIARSGAALVVATHDTRIASLFDRVWSMRNGALDGGVVARTR